MSCSAIHNRLEQPLRDFPGKSGFKRAIRRGGFEQIDSHSVNHTFAVPPPSSIAPQEELCQPLPIHPRASWLRRQIVDSDGGFIKIPDMNYYVDFNQIIRD